MVSSTRLTTSTSKILNQHEDAQTAAEARASTTIPGRDNITVIVDVGEGDELSQPTEEYDVDALFGDDEITTELPVIEVDADPGHQPSPPNDAEANQPLGRPDNGVSCSLRPSSRPPPSSL